MKKITSLLAIGFASLGIQGASASLIIDFYVSAPGEQSSVLEGDGTSATENFNAFSTGIQSASGSTAVGAYTSDDFRISNADQFGGAGGSRYPAIPFGSTTGYLDVTFSSPNKYIGFWWSAGNPGNIAEFFSGGSKVAEFDTAYLNTFLGAANTVPNSGSGTSSSLGGTTYTNNDYWGTGSYYSGSPFAYINLLTRNGIGDFDQVRFSGSGFEFDNVTVSSGAITPDSSWVFFGDSVSSSAAVPEPGQVAASLLLLGGIGGYVFLKRRKAAKSAAPALA